MSPDEHSEDSRPGLDPVWAERSAEGAPETDRPPPLAALAGDAEGPAPTVIPPASECCPRCRRILLEGACHCDPIEVYLQAEAVRRAAWQALSAAERARARERWSVGEGHEIHPAGHAETAT